MKTFFTQPIGQLGRQNSLGFVGINVVLLVVGFGEIDVPIGLGNFVNFLWGFSLFLQFSNRKIDIVFPYIALTSNFLWWF